MTLIVFCVVYIATCAALFIACPDLDTDLIALVGALVGFVVANIAGYIRYRWSA